MNLHKYSSSAKTGDNTYFLSPGLQILNDFLNPVPSPELGIQYIRGTPIRPIRSINSEDLAYSSYPGVPKNIVRNIFSEVDKNRLPPGNAGYTNYFSRNPGINDRLKDRNYNEVIEYEHLDPNWRNAYSTRLPDPKISSLWLKPDKPSITSGYDGGYTKPRDFMSRYTGNHSPRMDKQLLSTGLQGKELVRQHELGHALDDILNNSEAIYSTNLDQDLYGMQYKPWGYRKLLGESHFDNSAEALNGISSLARGLRAKAYAEGKDYSPSSQYQKNEFKRILNMDEDQFDQWFGQNKHYFTNPDPILRFRNNFRTIKTLNPKTTNLSIWDKIKNIFKSEKK